MKKIGFADYYISEWHANNYPAWIKKVNEELGTDYEVTYAWAELETSPVYRETTAEWCLRNGVEKCDTLAELCEKSDYIIVLAPSDPQKHLDYAKQVLPYGKPTYIDKTFSPDLATAKEIFKIAEKHGTPFFSTSALRFASELDSLEGADKLFITGGGGNFPEYIVHTAEMAVKLLKSPSARVKAEQLGKQWLCRTVCENGKEAAILFSPSVGFGICAENSEKSYINVEIKSDFFSVLMEKIIKFFETGVLPFDPSETLEVMRLREALIGATATPDEWIELA